MKSYRSKTAILMATAALVLVGVFGVFAYQSVYAQAGTPTATPGDAVAPGGPLDPAVRGSKMRGGYTSAALAEALGITPDELSAAYTTANTAALKQAVEAGLLTQEQADALNVEGGRLSLRGLRGLRGSSIDYSALLADALGITPDELSAAISTASAASVEIFEELRAAYTALHADEKFQASMQSAHDAALAQAVQDGVITQAQADEITAQGGGWSKLGLGGRGMRGGHGGGMHGFPATPETTP